MQSPNGQNKVIIPLGFFCLLLTTEMDIMGIRMHPYEV